MTVIALAGARVAPEAGQGGALVGLPLGRSGGLLLGWHNARLPRRGGIAAPGGDPGPYRLTAWPRAEGGCWFLAALQVPGGLVPDGPVLEMHLPGRAPQRLTPWAGKLADPAGFAAALAAQTGAYAGAIALFLADLTGAASTTAQPLLARLLDAYCAATAEEDGVVEVIGRAGDALVLQGWGDALAVMGGEALVLGAAPRRLPLQVLRFDRADIAAPACGLVHVVDAGTETDLPIAALHLVFGTTLRRRTLVPRATELPRNEVAPYLRTLLPQLAGSDAAIAAARRLARPPYAGVETLGDLPGPIAAAPDLCLPLPGIGVMLAGWLLDPSLAMASAVLHGPGGYAAPVLPHWQRLERPDVVQGFAADPRFRLTEDARPGFAAFLPAPPPAGREGWHLAIETATGERGYLPLRPPGLAPRDGLRRAAGLVDLHRPSGRAIAEQVLAPLLAAAIDQLPPPAHTLVQAPPGGRTALLLALPRPDGPAAAALSGFLADPLAVDETLVVICGPEWRGAPLAGLVAALRFYGLAAGIAVAASEPELPEAWEIGARVTDAPLLVPLTAAGPVGPRGWRDALRDALPDGAGIAAPALLHEDGAIRSLGFDARDGALRWRSAGLPAGAVPAGSPRRVLGAALTGAVISRAAWHAAGGFAAAGLTGPAQEAAFFLRLAAADGVTRLLTALRLQAPVAALPPAPWRDAAAIAERSLLAHLLRSLPEGVPACAS